MCVMPEVVMQKTASCISDVRTAKVLMQKRIMQSLFMLTINSIKDIVLCTCATTEIQLNKLFMLMLMHCLIIKTQQ